jgi:transglutaminase-like putative cysteine protease
VVESPSNWCVPKSVLLTAAARSQGIPARLGFADVRNHLTSEKLKAQMSSDVFAWHGYSEVLLDDGWHKLSTAFNVELCERFGVKTLEFDGTGDALMHPFDTSGRQHMEYIRQRGSYDDLPLDEIMATFAEVYGEGMMSGRRADSAEAAGDDAFAS